MVICTGPFRQAKWKSAEDSISLSRIGGCFRRCIAAGEGDNVEGIDLLPPACNLFFAGCGQFSVNISKPGITKGQHWHNSKWEFFMVVSGHGLIQERKIGTDEIREFEVSGEQIQAVHMLPGYTHNIINLSQTDDLVTVMWANEAFDPEHPDTFYEAV